MKPKAEKKYESGKIVYRQYATRKLKEMKRYYSKVEAANLLKINVNQLRVLVSLFLNLGDRKKLLMIEIEKLATLLSRRIKQTNNSEFEEERLVDLQ